MNNEKDVKDTGIVSQESINRAIEANGFTFTLLVVLMKI